MKQVLDIQYCIKELVILVVIREEGGWWLIPCHIRDNAGHIIVRSERDAAQLRATGDRVRANVTFI